MKAPFPYFGGKSRVAHVVWDRFGDVPHYIEPFFGSGAVLLSRPDRARHETINDADGLLANFWRSVQQVPDEVARHADWPVNEADLHARHLWLLGQRESITMRLMGDPEWCDPRAAGWWVWGVCQKIGGGWCSGKGPWVSVDGVLMKGDGGMGVSRGLPHLCQNRGVHRNLPDFIASRSEYLLKTFAELQERLRGVRVACGDWTRVMSPSVTQHLGTCGIFFDPPYATEARSTVYAHDSTSAAHDVRKWCLENGANTKLRIALCGYDGEHNELVDAGWSVHVYEAGPSYGKGNGGRGDINAKLERIWFSPQCLKEQQSRLF